jgi:hypothetical protein
VACYKSGFHLLFQWKQKINEHLKSHLDTEMSDRPVIDLNGVATAQACRLKAPVRTRGKGRRVLRSLTSFIIDFFLNSFILTPFNRVKSRGYTEASFLKRAKITNSSRDKIMIDTQSRGENTVGLNINETVLHFAPKKFEARVPMH